DKFDRGWKTNVAREPRAVAISPDGKKAYVSHASAGIAETVDVASGKTSDIDLGVARAIPAPRRFMRHIEPFMLDFTIWKESLHHTSTEDEADIDAEISFTGAPGRFARQAFSMIIVTDPKGGDPKVIIPLTEVAPGDARIVSSGYGGGGIETEVEDFP